MLVEPPQVVTAAQGRIPVYLDGGVRRGTDVFKALALGASGIFVSAPLARDPSPAQSRSCCLTQFLFECSGREAGGVRAGGGGRGGRPERAADAAGGVRADHGAQRLHDAGRHQPQPHPDRRRPPPPHPQVVSGDHSLTSHINQSINDGAPTAGELDRCAPNNPLLHCKIRTLKISARSCACPAGRW
jgi:hypothetical protein